MATAPLNPEPEIVTVTPTLKAYGEFFAVNFIMLIYDWFVALLILIAILWHRFRIKYKINADTIVFERGIIMKTTKTLNIMRIKEIILKQGPVQEFLNIGSLRIVHSDPTLPTMTIKGIPYPADLKALIARNIRRMREARVAAKEAEQAMAQATRSP